MVTGACAFGSASGKTGNLSADGDVVGLLRRYECGGLGEWAGRPERVELGRGCRDGLET